jgi:Uma2 family endonuclease
VVATAPETSTPAPDQDQRVLMHGMSWWQFETILAARGDNPVPRIAYLEGTVELMSPSRRHEGKKSLFGMLIEAYCFEKGVRFEPMASTTLKNAAVERGAEPDESYAFRAGAEVPDLAIEVVYTSGGLNKRAIYRGLGVREVWFWMHDHLEAYALEEGDYVRIDDSRVLPGIPLPLIDALARTDDAYDAVQSFRAQLGGDTAPSD